MIAIQTEINKSCIGLSFQQPTLKREREKLRAENLVQVFIKNLGTKES